MDNFFSINQLNYSYQQQKILHNLSFNLKAGECLALLGPSGIGKSTLLQIIAGLFPAESGEIYLEEKLLTHSGKPMIPCEKRQIAMVFQNYALFPQMNVRENIAFGMHRHRHTQQEIETRTQYLLNLMHMPALAKRFPHELSGGQQQRVALARALAIQPKLLLLDEPFANIDTTLRSQLHAELQRIIQDQKLSVLLVTHDRQEAFALAHRVGVLSPSTVGATLSPLATPQEIYAFPENIMVAQLTGDVNLFPGELKNNMIETPFGPWACNNNLQGKGTVVTRPEHLLFIPNTQGKTRVVSQQFLGAKKRLILETPVGILLVDIPSDQSVSEHQTGNISLLKPSWFCF